MRVNMCLNFLRPGPIESDNTDPFNISTIIRIQTKYDVAS